MSTPSASRWVAKLCRSVCGVTRLLGPAASAARLDHPAELALDDRPGRVLAGEQPARRPHDALAPALLPPGPEQRQQVGREQGVTATTTRRPAHTPQSVRRDA